MTQVAYDLAAFTQDLDRLAEGYAGEPRALVQAARPYFDQLLADVNWLDPRAYEPSENPERSVQYLLHRHPERAYTIVSVVFPVGYSTTVHDHGAWGLIGVWRGEEQEERFKRMDDRSRPDHAELRAVGTVVNPPGTITHLIPPDEDVHRIRNLAPVPSCSIHIYGADLDGKLRHQFDLETGAIKDFQTTTKLLA